MSMNTKMMLMQTGFTLATLWAIHNIKALTPVKDFLNFDQ